MPLSGSTCGPSSILAYEGDGRWQEYEGGYDDYLIQRQRMLAARGARINAATPLPSPAAASAPTAQKPSAPEAPKPKASTRLSNKERAALEQLPSRIEDLETAIAKIQTRLADPLLYKQDPASIPALQTQLETLEADLLGAMDQWELLLQKESGQTA